MTLTLQKIYQNEIDNYGYLLESRWPEKWCCPRCGAGADRIGDIAARGLMRCNDCRYQFSVLSGTALSGMKLSPTQLMVAVFIFCTNAKGISSVQMGKTIGVTQKTAFVLMHKFREAIERDVATVKLSGMVEIDAATFGGHLVLENSLRTEFPTRIYRRETANRRVLVVARERDGRTVPFVGHKESDALPDMLKIIQPGSVIIADEAHAWDGLKRAFEMLRISHKYSFSKNGANTNYAESFWSVMRKSHRGVYHQWGGDQVHAYACEIAWRQDFRAESVEDRTMRLLRLCLKGPVSAKWSGYWQRGKAA